MPYLSKTKEAAGLEFFQAPKGFIYEITDIHASVVVADAGAALIILARGVEQPSTVTSVNTRLGGSIAVIPMDLTIVSDVEFSMNPIRTKYITVAFNTGAPTGLVWWLINYELVRATQEELVWEFIGKKR